MHLLWASMMSRCQPGQSPAPGAGMLRGGLLGASARLAGQGSCGPSPTLSLGTRKGKLLKQAASWNPGIMLSGHSHSSWAQEVLDPWGGTQEEGWRQRGKPSSPCSLLCLGSGRHLVVGIRRPESSSIRETREGSFVQKPHHHTQKEYGLH